MNKLLPFPQNVVRLLLLLSVLLVSTQFVSPVVAQSAEEDVEITMSASQPIVEPGDEDIIFTITITNNGTEPLNSLRLEADFDPQLDVVALINLSGAAGSVFENQLIAGIITIPPGSSLSVQVRITVLENALPNTTVGGIATVTLQDGSQLTTERTRITVESPEQDETTVLPEVDNEDDNFAVIAILLLILGIAALGYLFRPNPNDKLPA